MEDETKRTGKRMEGLAVVEEDGEQVVGGAAVGGEWRRVCERAKEAEDGVSVYAEWRLEKESTRNRVGTGNIDKVVYYLWKIV